MLTLEQAKDLYLTIAKTYEFSEQTHSDEGWDSIRREMECVVEAKTDRKAGASLLWWGCWDKKRTATGFARRVRQYHAKLNHTINDPNLVYRQQNTWDQDFVAQLIEHPDKSMTIVRLRLANL